MQEFKAQKIKAVFKSLLKKKEMTYEELATQIECSVPTIKRILGSEELSLNRVLQLCEILEITLADLEELTKDTKEKPERFTPEQEDFLAKNKNYFAYLMKLFGGDTPKQIAEKFNLTQRSTDKYLIGLEKQNLIRVTSKQKVRPVFKNQPSLGSGKLSQAYYEAFIRNAGQFFISRIQEIFQRTAPGQKPDLEYSRYSVQTLHVSPLAFQNWMEEQSRLFQSLEKVASFEEKSKPEEELMQSVVVLAHTLVPKDYKGLDLIENTFGSITNI